MTIAPYQLVLALPGLRSLMLIGLLARVPATAVVMTITLHVVTSLDLGYAQAGLAGALAMAGVGLGAPLAGRFVDRLGTRPVMAVTMVAQMTYWAIAPDLAYGTLVACGFVAGVLSIPIFGVMRQYLAATVPPERRRTAFALDSISVELSYMLGPALAVAGVTTVGSGATMYAIGAGMLAAGVALIVANPPIRSAAEQALVAEVTPRRQWLTGGMATLLTVSAAITFVLSATELSIVATLGTSGATAWTGLVIGVWCAYSIVGGFVYGALHHGVSPLLLIGGLGALTIPVSLVGGSWWWLLVVLFPAGLLCSPSIAATVDTVSAWVPAGARGEAMGLHSTALTVGLAIGAPAAGAVIDTLGPAWGYAVAGGVGLLVVMLAVPLWPGRRHLRSPEPLLAGAQRSSAAGIGLG